MYLAFEELPADIKQQIAELTINHDASLDSGGNPRADFKGTGANHPIVRTHPVTGRKCLYVNPLCTDGIEGMPDAEGKPLLEELYSLCTRPELTYRHHWRKGDLLMWDNCSALHIAVMDYALPQRRRMHRTTITGTVPF